MRPYLWNQRRPLMLVFVVFWTGVGVGVGGRAIIFLARADSGNVTFAFAFKANNIGREFGESLLVVAISPFVGTSVVAASGIVAVVIDVVYINRGFRRSFDGVNG